MIGFISLGLISFLALWIGFVNVMTWKHNKHKIPQWLQYLLWPIAAAVYCLDVVFNWAFASIIYFELPREPTLSERMRRHIITRDDWRFKLSVWTCKYLVEPWDWNHCGLSNDRN